MPMSHAKSFYFRFRHLILYGIIGTFTATLDFLCFLLLSKVLGTHYLIANCISVLVGITTSFLLNRSYNFRVKDQAVQRFVVFLAVGLAGMLLSNLILYVSIDELGIRPAIAKLLSIVLVVFFQFLLNKYVTFRTTTNHL